MTLQYPAMLLLLLLIPLLVLWRYGKKRRVTIRFSDTSIIANLSPSWAILLQPLLPLCYILGLACLVLALARPLKGLEESIVRTEVVDIVLLVDVSSSMLAEDFSSRLEALNRLEAAKKVIRRFIEQRKHDRIGMVAFAAMPYTVSPLTLDHGWLLQQVEHRLRIGELEDGTAIGSALASAVNRLRNSKATSKVVILLTDGVNNAGSLSPDNAAQAAQALGVKVYTVGAGSSGWVRMPITDVFGVQRFTRQRSEIDEATLRRIADVTGATYFRAKNQKELQKVYADIDQMEKTEIEVEQFTSFEERFMPFVMLSMICLGAERLLGLTRLGRLAS